jgi:hypothetical protein
MGEVNKESGKALGGGGIKAKILKFAPHFPFRLQSKQRVD